MLSAIKVCASYARNQNNFNIVVAFI